MERDELYATFNMGIGFCLVVDPNSVAEVTEQVKLHNPSPIGKVVAGEGVRLS